MENQLELFVNGTNDTIGQINLYGDEPISLNISIQDVKDISKRNSTFSQTFTIPADKNNNILLNHIFNIGSDSTFDPRKKTPCFMLNDTVPVFTGQFQLTKINVKNKNVISYECVVYGEVIDLVKILGDKLLTDLDYSETIHNRDSNTIIESWFADTKTLGYYYPLIDYGYDFNIGELNAGTLNIIYDNGYQSSSTINTLTDSSKTWIINQYNTGYKVNIVYGTGRGQSISIISNTSNTLTLASNWITTPDATSFYTITKLDTTNPYNSTGVGLIPDQLKPAVSNYYLFNKIFNNAGFAFQSDILNSEVFSETIIPFNGQNDDKYYNFNIRLSYGYSSTLGPQTDNFNVYFHRSSLSTGISTTGPGTCFCHIIPRAEHIILTTPITINNHQDYNVTSCNLDGGATTFNTGTLPPGWFGVSNNAWRYPAKVGETFWVEIRVVNNPTYHHIFDTNTSFFNKAVSLSGDMIDNFNNNFRASISTPLNYINTNPVAFLNFNFNDVVTPPNFNNIYDSFSIVTKKYTKIDAITLDRYIPAKIKQIDYIKSIITMFNLMIIPDKNSPNRLFIVSRNEYFNTGIIKDWTDKVNHNEKIEETLISEQQSRTIKLTYKSDKDYYNTFYTDNTKTIFGEYVLDLENEWVEGEKKIEVIFSPTPVGKLLGSNDIYLPIIAKFDEKTSIYGRTDCNIRFIRKRKLPLLTEHTLKFENNTTLLNVYPYCGHLDHPLEPQIDYNFDTVKFSFYPELTYLPADNLVNLYWKNYLDEISDKNAKLIKCKIYLTPNDIATFNYNDSIYIDGLTDDGGHYFYVNKITYSPTSNLPSTVELIKTFKQVPYSRRTFTLGSPVSLGPVKRLEFGSGNNTQSMSITQGNNNNIGTNSNGAVIIGDGNTIPDNTKNVVLINTFNKTVDEPFVTIIGNTYFYPDGTFATIYNDIENGLDEVIDPFATNPYNDIDNGVNAVLNPGSSSPVKDIDNGSDIAIP